AEDGIRDRNVTGVQTCALPISYLENENISHQLLNRGEWCFENCSKWCQFMGQCGNHIDHNRSAQRMSPNQYPLGRHSPLKNPFRSEERRVGTEWRCTTAA